MKILGPTPVERVNEACGLVYLAVATGLTLALVSYHPEDPSWNVATGRATASNLMGSVGSHLSDLLLQTLGLAAFLLPLALVGLGWMWVHSRQIEASWAKLLGAVLLFVSCASLLAVGPNWTLFSGTVPLGGQLGLILAGNLIRAFNLFGTVLAAFTGVMVSMYLLFSEFCLERLPLWLQNPMGRLMSARDWWKGWLEASRQRGWERAQRKAEIRARKRAEAAAQARVQTGVDEDTQPTEPRPKRTRTEIVSAAVEDEIPIRTIDGGLRAEAEMDDDGAPPFAPSGVEPAAAPVAAIQFGPKVVAYEAPVPTAAREAVRARTVANYDIPPSTLMNEPDARGVYDPEELKETAGQIKSKFEEFNVLGSVTQINPGPVVTTFEFKPEAGIKYSRITTLTEDLCLGLQAESIIIERIPGKPTVGIEVPNTRRETISLRQVIESDEFQKSPSRLTIAMGKDASGRIRVAQLETMPHLLIAGSTGSGKSVMLNSLIMSVLYKATPNDVKMILIDPKRVEMGIYEGIPHLLTPVITDPRKATNALRNAVLEMERRLKLLASQGVRNIDQFNKKVATKLAAQQAAPRDLFEDQQAPVQEEPLQLLPYILLVIDELADLMMLERAGVEESITRLAQMARAVGMHLVVATQRPSVDVITGLIKANFPARVSFRVATRVDSRTILDVMGAEHLLGKGDMLFLPPGSSRLTRLHAPYVSEGETAEVVEFWKAQAQPEYDQSFLLAPPSDDETISAEDAAEGADDPAYQDAVRVVLEVGKASTSILQRRLRLGYGRAARLLDVMQREGIIGPPDGPRPREVLKAPNWLDEVESSLR
jgi:DNA segregation ATPase FtsK/SpoIIIE, S-DNA-T family